MRIPFPTIKKIQDETETYILTPSRVNRPDIRVGAAFEVRGEKSNVLRARELMYQHIFHRTRVHLEMVDDQVYGIDAALNRLEVFPRNPHDRNSVRMTRDELTRQCGFKTIKSREEQVNSNRAQREGSASSSTGSPPVSSPEVDVHPGVFTRDKQAFRVDLHEQEARAHHRMSPFAYADSLGDRSAHSSAFSSTNSSVESSPAMGLGLLNWARRRPLCSGCGRRECVNFPSKCGHATLCSQCFQKFLCADPACPGYYGRVAPRSKIY